MIRNLNSINIENNPTDNEDVKIDKNLRNTLAPFQLINFLTLNSRHHIVKNRIKIKDKLSILLTILGTIFIICQKGYELYVLSYKNGLSWYKSVANFSMFFDIFFYTIAYIFHTATLIISREQNASIIVKLNKIYKSLSVKKQFTFRTILAIAIYFLIYFGVQNRTILYNTKYFKKDTEVCMSYFSLYLLASFDLNIIFAILIMKLLKIIMEAWTSKIKKYEEEEEEEAGIDKLYDHYVSVMDAYNTYNDLLQNMVRNINKQSRELLFKMLYTRFRH